MSVCIEDYFCGDGDSEINLEHSCEFQLVYVAPAGQ